METMKKRQFNAFAIGYSDNQVISLCNWFNIQSGKSKVRVKSSVTIKGDPGYLETATMISECAFALALDRER